MVGLANHRLYKVYPLGNQDKSWIEWPGARSIPAVNIQNLFGVANGYPRDISFSSVFL